MLEAKRLAELKESQEKARIENIKLQFVKDIEDNSAIYPANAVIYNIAKEILALPPVLSEGKLNDEWFLQDWNCYAAQDPDLYFEKGIKYDCAVNYVAADLALDTTIDLWASEFLSEDTSYNGIKLISGIKAAPIKYSFIVMPVPYDSKSSLTQEDIVRNLEAVAETGRKEEFSFIYDKQPEVLGHLSSHSEAISILKNEGVEDKYFAFQYGFTLSLELGKLGSSNISLPFNSVITRVSGTPSVINIKGKTKYEREL